MRGDGLHQGLVASEVGGKPDPRDLRSLDGATECAAKRKATTVRHDFRADHQAYRKACVGARLVRKPLAGDGRVAKELSGQVHGSQHLGGEAGLEKARQRLHRRRLHVRALDRQRSAGRGFRHE